MPDIDQVTRTYYASAKLVHKWREVANLAKVLPTGAINQAAIEILIRCADQLEATLTESTDERTYAQ